MSKYFEKLSGKSIIKQLMDEQKLSEEFLVMMNNLTLEQLIAVKLETSVDNFKGKMYGIPIFRGMTWAVEEACLRYAFSACKTKNEIAMFLGIARYRLKYLEEKYLKREL